jgi:hypothetical protein
VPTEIEEWVKLTEAWGTLCAAIPEKSKRSTSARSKTCIRAMTKLCLGRLDWTIWLPEQCEKPFLLRSDNVLVFTSRRYMALLKSSRLQQELNWPCTTDELFANGFCLKILKASPSHGYANIRVRLCSSCLACEKKCTLLIEQMSYEQGAFSKSLWALVIRPRSKFLNLSPFGLRSLGWIC